MKSTSPDIRKWAVFAAACLLSFLVSGPAEAYTNYYVVGSNENAASPFTNWAMASTNLNDPINISLNGDAIYVTNDIYVTTNNYGYTLNRAITIAGYGGMPVFNGNGTNLKTAMFHLNNTGAVLSGLIISNVVSDGNYASYQGASGGGIRIVSGMVSNCIVTWCITTNDGANSYFGGGGIFIKNGSIVGCVISNNRAGNADCSGGGIACRWNTSGGNFPTTQSIVNCTIVNNYGGYSGGGIGSQSSQTTISNCTILANSDGAGYWRSGSGIFINQPDCSAPVVVRNCLIAYNIHNPSTDYRGALYANGSYVTVENCTIVSNNDVGFVNGSGTSVVANSIIYFSSISNIALLGSSASFTNCCTTPTNNIPGTNNIAFDPFFVNKDAGNFHLAQGSPCINTGANRDWMNRTFDLDGHQRLDRFSRIVDMGCYEFLPSGTLVTIPGLSQ
jgi:hypothetical protein